MSPQTARIDVVNREGWSVDVSFRMMMRHVEPFLEQDMRFKIRMRKNTVYACNFTQE